MSKKKWPWGRMTGAILLIIVGIVLYQSIWKVPTGHRGVAVVLGRIRPEPFGPGLHAILPWPLAEIRMIPTDSVRQIQITADSGGVLSSQSSEYLTGEENLLEAEIRVDYRISDALEIARNGLDRSESSLKMLSEGALIETLAATPVTSAIGPQREEIGRKITAAIQSQADRLGLGLQVVSTTWLALTPPVEVRPDFEAAQSAASEAAQAEARAKTEVEAIRQQTLATAAAEKSEAQAKSSTRIAEARAEAARFTALRLQARRTGLMLTAKELWLDTISRILPSLRGRMVLATDQPVDLTIIRNQGTSEPVKKP
jgi:membrane protease subunit HflK